MRGPYYTKNDRSSTEEYKHVHTYFACCCAASQTWCLLRLLPLIIGDCIPSDNPNWSNFLRLLELVDYVTAPETTCEIAGYLRDLIEDHHKCFKELYHG